jgi:hypothetical protein
MIRHGSAMPPLYYIPFAIVCDKIRQCLKELCSICRYIASMARKIEVADERFIEINTPGYSKTLHIKKLPKSDDFKRSLHQ